MHTAAAVGQVQIARMLMERYPEEYNLEAATANGHTPLHIAVAFRQANMVGFLLREQCDMGAVLRCLKGQRQRPLRWAYDSDRCSVHDNHCRIVPTPEDDGSTGGGGSFHHKQSTVPASLASPLPQFVGLNYFEVRSGEVSPQECQRLGVKCNLMPNNSSWHACKPEGTLAESKWRCANKLVHSRCTMHIAVNNCQCVYMSWRR